MKNLPYLIALHSVDGLGSVRLKKIVDYFQDPKLAWGAGLKEFAPLQIPKLVLEKLAYIRKSQDPEKAFQQITQSGIKLVSIFDENYPQNLRQIIDLPTILYYRGEILKKDERSIGIVGTRKITGYGRTVTEKFAGEMALSGFTVVSGLARGVDSLAHQSAIAQKGRTIAVLGGGLNSIFPPENKGLAEKISQGFGAVLSEFPPHYPHLAGNFPARNRIIAGLSVGVLVTEAAEDSGSMITARFALDQGREVFAVPGPITSNLSKGPAELIKQGAKLVFEPSDILNELGVSANSPSDLDKSLPLLSEAEKTILECLKNESKHIDEICRSLQKPSSVISGALVKMEILGLVKNLGGGNYVKGL